MKTVYVNFQDNEKDYVIANIYDSITGQFIQELPNIIKPMDIELYTTQWKNGLMEHYKKLAELDFPNDIIVCN